MSDSSSGIAKYDFKEIDSTQAEVRRLVEKSAAPPEPFIVTAIQQSAGRGRLGRTWIGRRHNSLMFSIWLPIGHLSTDDLPLMSLAAAVATQQWLAPHLVTYLKWPNDILSSDLKKLAGILCEGQWQGRTPIGMIAGIGINVSWPQEPTYDDIRAAGGAALQDYCDVSLSELDAKLPALASAILAWQARISADGPASLAEAFNRNMAKIDRPVSLKSFESRQTVGYIEGVSESGLLRFRERSSGRILKVATGELSLQDTPFTQSD